MALLLCFFPPIYSTSGKQHMPYAVHSILLIRLIKHNDYDQNTVRGTPAVFTYLRISQTHCTTKKFLCNIPTDVPHY